MASILSEMNKRIENELGSEYVSAAGRKSVVSEVLDKYVTYKKEKNTFKITFLSANTDGTFSTMDGDVTIILPSEKFEKYAKSTHTHATANLLGVELEVAVYMVDEMARKVYVELSGGTKMKYASNLRNDISNEISRSINSGNHPIVWGKVVKVTKDKIMVDIFGKGVLGFLQKKHWGKDFVRTLEGVCKEGEYYQFEVISRAAKVEGKSPAWLLSRKNISESAWDRINVEGLQAGGVLLVTCIEKPARKSYWWGNAERLPGIEVMGDYTNKFTEKMNMYVSITYKCKIKYIDVESRKISVIPFEVIPADVPKVEGLRTLGGREKLSQ